MLGLLIPGLACIRQAGVPCRVVARGAAELIVYLMRKAVAQDPAALQQLAASPATLSFLVSPVMVSPRVGLPGAVLCKAREKLHLPRLPQLAGSYLSVKRHCPGTGRCF